MMVSSVQAARTLLSIFGPPDRSDGSLFSAMAAILTKLPMAAVSMGLSAVARSVSCTSWQRVVERSGWRQRKSGGMKREPAIDPDRRPREVCGRLAGKKQHAICNVAGGSDPT